MADIEGRVNNFIDVSDFVGYTGEENFEANRLKVCGRAPCSLCVCVCVHGFACDPTDTAGLDPRHAVSSFFFVRKYLWVLTASPSRDFPTFDHHLAVVMYPVLWHNRSDYVLLGRCQVCCFPILWRNLTPVPAVVGWYRRLLGVPFSPVIWHDLTRSLRVLRASSSLPLVPVLSLSLACLLCLRFFAALAQAAEANDQYSQCTPDLDEYTKEPPPLPPHLRHIILNKNPPANDPSALPVPQHVVSRHAYRAAAACLVLRFAPARFFHRCLGDVLGSPCRLSCLLLLVNIVVCNGCLTRRAHLSAKLQLSARVLSRATLFFSGCRRLGFRCAPFSPNVRARIFTNLLRPRCCKATQARSTGYSSVHIALTR